MLGGNGQSIQQFGAFSLHEILSIFEKASLASNLVRGKIGRLASFFLKLMAILTEFH